MNARECIADSVTARWQLSFRRAKETALEAKRWIDFLSRNDKSLATIGIPRSIYASHEMFVDFLMHGYIDHHADLTRFSVGELSSNGRDLLTDVIANYLIAGFPDPGLAIAGIDVADVYRRAGMSRSR